MERAIHELRGDGRPDAETLIVFLTGGTADAGNTEQDTDDDPTERPGSDDETRPVREPGRG